MTDKAEQYRELVNSLYELGTKEAAAITTDRYRIMFHYFVRCVRLALAIILLVEKENLVGAYALEKSLIDALLTGLYLCYSAPEPEFQEILALALSGRGTGYSKMKHRAREIDRHFAKRKAAETISFVRLVRENSESLNEFGHGGLLSMGVESPTIAPAFTAKRLSRSAFVPIMFLAHVFRLEGIELAPLKALMGKFTEIGGELER